MNFISNAETRDHLNHLTGFLDPTDKASLRLVNQQMSRSVKGLRLTEAQKREATLNVVAREHLCKFQQVLIDYRGVISTGIYRNNRPGRFAIITGFYRDVPVPTLRIQSCLAQIGCFLGNHERADLLITILESIVHDCRLRNLNSSNDLRAFSVNWMRNGNDLLYWAKEVQRELNKTVLIILTIVVAAHIMTNISVHFNQGS